MSDLTSIIAQRLEIKPELLIHNQRIVRILSHYRKAITKGHMRLSDAADRCYGDICGRNYHSEREQRSDPIWRA